MYSAVFATDDEVAAEDPFQGHGAFFAMDAAAEVILAALETAAGGTVAAVAVPGVGAWVDIRTVDPVSLRDAWDARRGK